MNKKLNLTKTERHELNEILTSHLEKFSKHAAKSYIIIELGSSLKIRVYRYGLHCTCTKRCWYGSMVDLKREARRR